MACRFACGNSNRIGVGSEDGLCRHIQGLTAVASSMILAATRDGVAGQLQRELAASEPLLLASLARVSRTCCRKRIDGWRKWNKFVSLPRRIPRPRKSTPEPANYTSAIAADFSGAQLEIAVRRFFVPLRGRSRRMSTGSMSFLLRERKPECTASISQSAPSRAPKPAFSWPELGASGIEAPTGGLFGAVSARAPHWRHARRLLDPQRSPSPALRRRPPIPLGQELLEFRHRKRLER